MKATKRKEEKSKPSSSIRLKAVVVGIIVLVGLAVFLFWQFNKPAGPLETSRVSQTFSPKLKGMWFRQDGEYVIEIRSISPDGMLDAAYFNPAPINVSRAEATQDGTTTKLYLELRDVNYPGSYYTLTYDAAADQLRGAYYQAVLKQVFDVTFVRKP